MKLEPTRILLLWSVDPEIESEDSRLKQSKVAMDLLLQHLEEEGIDARTVNIEDDITRLIDAVTVHDPHAIWSFIDRLPGEMTGHACIPAVCASLEYNVIGSESLAISSCADRSVLRERLHAADVPGPEWKTVRNSSDSHKISSKPAVVSQVFDDIYEAEGLARSLESDEEVRDQLDALNMEYSYPFLVEEYVEGDRLHVLVYGYPSWRVSPVVEEQLASKYGEDEKYDFLVTDLTQDEQLLLQDLARRACDVMGVRDCAIVDIHIGDAGPKVVDVRPLLELTGDVPFWAAAKACPKGIGPVLNNIVTGALARVGIRLTTRSDVFRAKLQARLANAKKRYESQESSASELNDSVSETKQLVTEPRESISEHHDSASE